MHWKGQQNTEAPFMDGVPMVTQCPIASYTTFQYKVRASTPGTHFYHAYSHTNGMNGLFGALVVRQADNVEQHRNMYDLDLKEHVILLSEWYGDKSRTSEKPIPSAILLNGRDASVNSDSPTVISVSRNKRYRFRIAYAHGITGRPITLTVDNHMLKAIAIDGHPITPYSVSSVIIAKGERVDFVLEANQESGVHLLRATSYFNQTKITGSALVTYDGATKSRNEVNFLKNFNKFDSSVCTSKVGTVCINQAQSLNSIIPELGNLEVDKKFYLSYDQHHVELDRTEGKCHIVVTNNLIQILLSLSWRYSS